MCSDAWSPIFFQLAPASRLRYTPSPNPTWRPPTFSPLPTHTISGWLGSMVTQPTEYDASFSNTGCQVVPAFVVFQRPPLPTATYQMSWSLGWMAMSLTRPEVMAGPMFRNSSPLNGSFLSFFSGAAAVLPGLGPAAPAIEDDRASASTTGNARAGRMAASEGTSDAWGRETRALTRAVPRAARGRAVCHSVSRRAKADRQWRRPPGHCHCLGGRTSGV